MGLKYNYGDNFQLEVQPLEWDKFSGKSTLQYAVGALLYTPATNTKIAEKIVKKELPLLKSIALCLEDSIGDDMVKKAEKDVKNTLMAINDAIEAEEISFNDLPLIFIRVRSPKQLLLMGKKLSRLIELIAGFIIPKVDNSNVEEYVCNFKSVLDDFECANLYIMPIMESVGIMSRQTRLEHLHVINTALKDVSDYVLNIRVGGTDFSHIYGIRRSINDTIWDIAVVADCLSDIINYFGGNYIVAAAVWEYFGIDPYGKWLEGLKREIRLDKLNGCIGKTAIHPNQLSVIQESLIVSYEDYKDATNILGMAQGIVGVQKGCGNNKMNEAKTHINWAKRIVGLAEVYGVSKQSGLF